MILIATTAVLAVSGMLVAQQTQTPPTAARSRISTPSGPRVQGPGQRLHACRRRRERDGRSLATTACLVVDTQFAQMADKLLAEIARISGNKPIRYVINTHVHPDHVGGNERFRRAGKAIVAGNVAFDLLGNEGGARSSRTRTWRTG